MVLLVIFFKKKVKTNRNFISCPNLLLYNMTNATTTTFCTFCMPLGSWQSLVKEIKSTFFKNKFSVFFASLFLLIQKKKNLVFSFIILHLTRQPPPSLRCKYLGILDRLVRMVTCLLFHYSFYLNSFCMLSCIYILAINVFPPNFFELYLNLVSA